MGEQYSKMELKAIAKFLKKVFPGVSDQDELWNLLDKTQLLIKGKSDAQTNQRRGNS